MKKIYAQFIALTGVLLFAGNLGAQTTINTTVGSTGYTGGNGAGANYAITFAIENNSGGPILLTDVSSWWNVGESGSVSLYYSSTSLNGSVAVPVPSPPWTFIQSGTETVVTAGLQTITWASPLSFTIPSGTQYRFALLCGGYCRYSGTGVGTCTPNVFTSGGVSLEVGDYMAGGGYVGYGATNGPRFFTGTVTFMPAGPCTSPPTAGTTTTTNANPCTGSSYNLGLTGNTGGTGQTYQWQSGPTATGPWTNIGTASGTPSLTQTATVTTYYRANVICGSQSAYSTPVAVTVPALFPAGTYTINSAVATGGSNFQSYNAAVSAISCGTTGPVVFNVVAGSGPYNEQVTIPQISTNSATNTITFNGNNTTINYNNASTSNYAIFKLDGADYIRVKKVNIVPNAASTNAFGILITNDADNDIIDSCTVDLGQTVTGTNFSGIIVGGSSTSATTGTVPCDSNIISNNTVIGGYYCVTNVGTSTTSQYNNQFLNNTIRDYYVYGLYMIYNTGTQVIGNDLHRTNRPSSSTFYGIVNSTGNLKSNISRNRIHNPFTVYTTGTTGYYLYNSNTGALGFENVFSNNAVYNMDGLAGTQYIMYSYGNYAKWYHNTISSDYAGATSGATYGYYQASSTYNVVEVKNNIISVTRGGTGAKYAVYHSTAGYATVMNNNDYFVGNGALVGYYGAATTTLANWQTASGQDANSVSLDPVFTAPATGNLLPTSVPLNNLGTPVGITTDILGLGRSATVPDMGAYEFGSAPCNAITGLAASAITSTTATLSWTAVTGASGYEYVIDNVATNPAGAGTAITAATYNATGLTPYTQYYAHVRTNCNPGLSTWVTISFTTLCANPVATITVNGATSVCAPDSVLLHANRASGISYQWKKNTVVIAGATDSLYYARTSGDYTVTTSISTCNTTSAITTINVNAKPDTTVTVTPTSGIICSGNTAALSGVAVTGATYQWYLNGAPISGANTSTYTASAAGDYRLRVTNATSCTDTSTVHTIVVNQTPTVGISPATATAICAGSNVVLTANGAASYTWSPATGLSATTGATVTANPATTTTYSITGDGGNGCSATITKTVTVNALPTVDISPTTAVAVCAGSSATLTANGAASYTWSPPTGLSSTTAATVTATPTATITYTVTGIGANGCSNTATKTVTVNALPTVGVTPTGISGICIGGSIVLTANGASTYSWSPSGSLSSGTGTSVTASPATTTTYTITGTSAAGCVGTATKIVTATTTPVLVISPTTATSICAGSSVTLTATGAASYSWSPATGLSSTTLDIVTASPAATTTYTITGTTGGCSVSTTKTVTVNPLPAATITATGVTNLCTGNTVVLNANTGAGLTYIWRTNFVPNGTTTSSFVANTSGTYDVTVSNGLCSATSNAIPVVVSSAPLVSVTAAGPTTFCDGSNVRFSTISDAAYTYQWLLNGVNIPGATASSYIAPAAGAYSVVVTNISCSIPSSATTVTVNANPTAVATAQGSTTFCDGGSVTLSTPGTTGFTYQWTKYGSNIPGATGLSYVANASGNYSVKVTNTLSCTSAAPAIVVQAVVAPNPDISVVYGHTLVTQAYYSYQWYRNGTLIPGATSRDYTPTQNGVYTVEVTVVPGCNKTSAPVTIGNLAVGGVNATQVSFYPNPAMDIVNIVSDKTVNVSLSNLEGKEVLHQDHAKTLNISGIADGLYILRFFDKDGQLIKIDKLTKAVK